MAGRAGGARRTWLSRGSRARGSRLAGRSRLTCGARRPWLSRGPSTRGSRLAGRSRLTCRCRSSRQGQLGRRCVSNRPGCRACPRPNPRRTVIRTMTACCPANHRWTAAWASLAAVAVGAARNRQSWSRHPQVIRRTGIRSAQTSLRYRKATRSCRRATAGRNSPATRATAGPCCRPNRDSTATNCPRRTVTRATNSACRSASNWNWSSGTRSWRAQPQPRTLPQSVL